MSPSGLLNEEAQLSLSCKQDGKPVFLFLFGQPGLLDQSALLSCFLYDLVTSSDSPWSSHCNDPREHLLHRPSVGHLAEALGLVTRTPPLAFLPCDQSARHDASLPFSHASISSTF